MGVGPKRQSQRDLNPWQRMKAAGETDRQTAAPQRSLQHPHKIQMAEQGHRTDLRETDSQPTSTQTRRRLRRHLGWNRRSGNHHVVAKIRTTDTATAASIKGTVRHHGCCQCPLEIIRQPAFVDAGVDVIPGERLAAERLEILPVKSCHRAPAPQFHLAVAAFKPCLSDRPGPCFIGSIECFKPGIHARTGPPGRLDHQAPVVGRCDRRSPPWPRGGHR